MPSPGLEDAAWAGIVRTLKAVGPVVTARRRVEETHGTAAEADAITALGDAITDLEEAWNALRTLNEHSSKDA